MGLRHPFLRKTKYCASWYDLSFDSFGNEMGPEDSCWKFWGQLLEASEGTYPQSPSGLMTRLPLCRISGKLLSNFHVFCILSYLSLCVLILLGGKLRCERCPMSDWKCSWWHKQVSGTGYRRPEIIKSFGYVWGWLWILGGFCLLHPLWRLFIYTYVKLGN